MRQVPSRGNFCISVCKCNSIGNKSRSRSPVVALSCFAPPLPQSNIVVEVVAEEAERVMNGISLLKGGKSTKPGEGRSINTK